MNILFAINPISGGRNKKDYEPAIRDFFSKLPHSIDIFLLDGKNDAANLDEWIEKVKPQTVVAVGGDGTVTMVACRLLGTDMKLGILPAGSANGMAKELGIPVNLNEALNIIIDGEEKSADVIKVNNKICLHLSDIGLNAKLVKYFEEGKVRGFIGYAKVAARVLWKKQRMSVIIQAKDSEIKREALMIVLANASKYGTGAVINPTGDLYDGLFEVVIIRKLPVAEILKMMLKPQPFNPKNIEVIHARAVSIETSHKVHFQVDGEYIGKVNKIKAEILKAQLNLLLPKSEQ